MTGLREGHILVRLRGSAGQSLGAFATQGLRLDVIGDANDYVGKGLSGGMIVVRPSAAVGFVASANTIIGNTVLYGATSGKLFAAGQAGERLCVRNSGATAVVEGSGSNACEYMTGGNVVILGEVGDNFGAGMTGGMAFIYDEAGNFESRVNRESLQLFRIAHPHWENKLRDLVAEHARETESALAARILNQWEKALQNFWQVVPTEIIPVLDVPLKLEDDLSETA
jgi:glutamate synthase (NADPH/NADH) large chain